MVAKAIQTKSLRRNSIIHCQEWDNVCIRTQVWIYSKIRPEPFGIALGLSGNPSGSGHILPYIPPLVLIRIQYSQHSMYLFHHICCRKLDLNMILRICITKITSISCSDTVMLIFIFFISLHIIIIIDISLDIMINPNCVHCLLLWNWA